MNFRPCDFFMLNIFNVFLNGEKEESNTKTIVVTNIQNHYHLKGNSKTWKA